MISSYRENLTTSNDDAWPYPDGAWTELMFAIMLLSARKGRTHNTLRPPSLHSTCWSAVALTVNVGSLAVFCKTREVCDVEVRGAPPLTETL